MHYDDATDDVIHLLQWLRAIYSSSHPSHSPPHRCRVVGRISPLDTAIDFSALLSRRSGSSSLQWRPLWTLSPVIFTCQTSPSGKVLTSPNNGDSRTCLWHVTRRNRRAGVGGSGWSVGGRDKEIWVSTLGKWKIYRQSRKRYFCLMTSWACDKLVC